MYIRKWLITLVFIAGCCLLFVRLLSDEQYLPSSSFPSLKIRNKLSSNLSNLREKKADKTGKYISQTFFWPSYRLLQLSEFKVCLATHTTVDGLHWIPQQADFFRGPVSVSVYTPGGDFHVAVRMIDYLRYCHAHVRDFVNFHILYPKSSLSDRDLSNIDPSHIPRNFTCSNSEEYNKEVLAYRKDSDIKTCRIYPQNIARNLAWEACKSKYVINLDVDMVPNYSMSSMMEEFFFEKQFEKTAFVLPVYEIKNNVDFPVIDKSTLLSLLEHKLAQIFHIQVYEPNQRNSQLSTWEKQPNESTLNVMYSIPQFKEYWEPIMVLPFFAPKFLEEFIGYGYTRSSHVYLLNQKKYSFKVFDIAFLSHRGFQDTTHYPEYRKKQISANSRLYKLFKLNLKRKRRKIISLILQN